MKIVLSTSPHVRHPAVLLNDFSAAQIMMYSFAPVGLLSLIGALRRDLGSYVHVGLFDVNSAIDFHNNKLSDQFYKVIAESIVMEGPDVVGFMTECDSYHHVLQMCQEIKELNPRIIIVLGGPHATSVAMETLKRYHCIDAIVKGEGEKSFVELIRSYLTGSELSIPGVAQRLRGVIHDGGSSALIECLDELPNVAYDLYVPSENEEIFLEVGRGCPFSCSFCSTAPYWGRRHRVKSPDRILSEIATVRSMYGASRIHFTHDLFTVDQRWVARVCDALKSANLGVEWTCSARTDTVSEKILDLMKEAGCGAVYFGLESGSNAMLKKINKPISIDRSVELISYCRDIGIRANAGFIVGLPGESIEELQQTFECYERVVNVGCKPTHIFAYCPFNGAGGYPGDSELIINNHFLDIPLVASLDLANRKLVTSEPDLFGAYRRSKNSALGSLGDGYLFGVDEFTPLVESLLAPTMYLSERTEGLLYLYKSWILWIEKKNDISSNSSYRRWYGSPNAFCEFLIHFAELNCAEKHLLAYLKFASHALKLGITNSSQASVTMAGFRTLEGVRAQPVVLNTVVSAKHVISILSISYDISGFLSWKCGESLPESILVESCYVWVKVEEETRLLRTGEIGAKVIKLLSSDDSTVASLWVKMLNDENSSLSADCYALQKWIESAISQGLLSELGETHA